MVSTRYLHDPPLVSIVIPTLNEAKNLPFVLPRIPEWVTEIILVDGHSTDGTVEIARQIKPELRVIHQNRRGKGDALRAGFEAAVGDIIIAMDADGSSDPGEILAFVALLRNGSDYVKGSRFIQGGGSSDMTVFRRIGNWGLMVLTRMLFGSNFSDLCYGYFAFWADTLPLLNPDVDGFEVEALINVRALTRGLKVAEVPSFEDDRLYGESHLRAIPDGWRILKVLFRESNRLRNEGGAQKIGPVREGKTVQIRERQVPVTGQKLPTSESYEADQVYQDGDK
jgi:glycosyltransferase involved in cell wall biosynthesis